MGRLIEEKSVIEIAEKCTFTDENERRKYLDFVRYCAKKSKTAYNQEAVVAELKNIHFSIDILSTLDTEIVVDYDEAIDIVKRGGVE